MFSRPTVLLLSLLVAACSADLSAPTPSPFVTVHLDGAPYVPDTVDLALYDGQILQLRLTEASSAPGRRTIIVSLEQWRGTGTYSLVSPPADYGWVIDDADPQSQGFLGFRTGDTLPGQAQIALVDSVAHDIEGTFSFTAPQYLPNGVAGTRAVTGSFRWPYHTVP